MGGAFSYPYFDDEFTLGEMRVVRGEDGESYYVPSDMTYPEWKGKFVDGGEKLGLTLSSGEVTIGETDGYTVLDNIKDLHSEAEIQRAISDFCTDYQNAEVEHSLVIKDNKAYYFTGLQGTVNPSIIGEDIMKGSIGVHNHPVASGDTMGDSFSIHDLIFSARFETGKEYLTSGERRNAFLFTQKYTEEEIRTAWESAKNMVRQKAFDGEIVIDFEQEEFMKMLATQLEGLEFYENIP